ncbi:MAG: ABC transporter permease [candidate division KSB1 bacterium]|nr:ABC transporter permease [candidate division KSB1 bacterium]MDZ7341125.1 ABC transporter permease [candidate division KSB1 bacterium]
MINLNYICKTLREHVKFLIMAFLMLGTLEFLIFMLVVEADFLNMAQIFIQKFPPIVQQYFNDQWLAQFSISGAVAFGYNHPFVLIFLAIIAIMLPARHIASEIEGGTLELLFSLPVKRLKIAFSLWLFSLFALLLVIIGCWIGTLVGTLVYPQFSNLSFSRLILTGINLWLLMLTINAYTFFLAAYSRECSRVTMQAAGITLFFYFLNYIARLWPKIELLRHTSIFNYYQPQKVMMGQTAFGANIAVPLILIIVFMMLAFWRMNRRDIPG